MNNTKLRDAINFSVFLCSAGGLLLALDFLKGYIQLPTDLGSASGMALIAAKLLLKFSPLLCALLIAYLLSTDRTKPLVSLWRWNRSRVIDLYCYILTHLHRVIGLLNILFTLSIPFLLDRLITQNIPTNFSLFSIIARSAGSASAIIIFALFASFCTYWEHRLWHTSIFWPIHRFHHSATDYNLLIETRKHFTEVLITPLFYTLPLTLLGAPVEFVVSYLSLILFQGFMNHSDGGIRYGWIGRWLWCDPVYHKIHHSRAPEHMNKNFSGTLPIWDRLFGTYADDARPIDVGVHDAVHYQKLPFWKIYIQDFIEFLGNLKTALKQVRIRRGSGRVVN